MFFESNHTSVKLTSQLGGIAGKYMRGKTKGPLDEAQGGIAVRAEQIVVLDQLLWAEFGNLCLEEGVVQKKFLQTTGKDRMKTLADIVDKHATPWQKRYDIAGQNLLSAVEPDWYAKGVTASGADAKGEY